MSALYKVMKDNDYFDAGIFVEEMSDGFVQPVELVQDGKFWRPLDNYGLLVPMRSVRDCLIKIQIRGLDKRW